VPIADPANHITLLHGYKAHSSTFAKETAWYGIQPPEIAILPVMEYSNFKAP